MSKTLTFEIPDDIYALLEQTAARWGRPIEQVALEWLSSTMPKKKPVLTEEERKAALARLHRHFGSVHSGDPRSADNEKIDADLMREYESTHEDGS